MLSVMLLRSKSNSNIENDGAMELLSTCLTRKYIPTHNIYFIHTNLASSDQPRGLVVRVSD